MSIWTHVVGCIRVDGLPGITSKLSDVKEAIGPMSTFENWNDESTIPSGSEGGLQYQIIEYQGGLPWLAIPIWGDLRDFDSPEEIATWWNELLPKLRMVRDAVLHIRVEGREPIILAYKEKAEV